MGIFNEKVNEFIENNTFDYVNEDIFQATNTIDHSRSKIECRVHNTNLSMRIQIMDQKYIVVNQDMYTELEFIELSQKHKSINKHLFNILKEYHPEYFI